MKLKIKLKMQKNNKIYKYKAFSLVELSITILVIGVLIAGIVGGSQLMEKTKIMTKKWQVQNYKGIEIPDVIFSSSNKLWLDAANINGSYNAGIKNNKKIASWIDISGNNSDVNQANSSKQPIYNGSAIIFDGSNDYFNVPNIFSDSLRATGIIVINDTLTLPVRNDGHWDFGNYGYAMQHYGGGSRTVYDNFTMNSRPLTASDIQINNQTQIYVIQNDGSQFTSYMDGVQAVQGISNGFNPRSNPLIGAAHGSGNTGGASYFKPRSVNKKLI